ncbi:MAG: ead/Ea22-like family protein [Gemmatimonadaceae bacterium]
MTTHKDIAELRTLAERATPGKWSVRETVINGIRYGGHWVETDHEAMIQITGSGGARSFTRRVFERQVHDDNEANAAYIAAASPAAVLALLRVAEAAEKRLSTRLALLDDPAARSLAERELIHALAALNLGTTP